MSLLSNKYERALASLRNGRVGEADALCREILLAEGRHAEALHLLGFIALQRAQPDQAVGWIGRSLAVNPLQPVACLNLANALLQQGDAARAVTMCDRALMLRPDYAEALGNRGTALLRLGKAAEALESYDSALRMKPASAQFHSNRGTALRELSRFGEALTSYECALRLAPDLLEARLGRAALLRDAGRIPEALRALDETIERFPGVALAHHERANLLFQQERRDEALRDYDIASRLAPRDADIAFNRAGVLYSLGQLEAALGGYDQAIALNPMLSKAHCYRGNALLRLRRHAEALESYQCALRLQPTYPAALCGASDALRELGRFVEALAAADQVLDLDHGNAHALHNRARCLIALRRPEEAAECFEQLRRQAPDRMPEYALGLMLHARLSCCDWRDYEELAAEVIAGVRNGSRLTLPSVFAVISDSAADQQRCAQLFADNNWAPAAQPAWTGPPYRHARIRLAYVSADFREHPVSQLLVRVLETHDREKFEVVGISLRPEHDSPLGQRVKRAFDRFIDVSGRSDREIVALLRELEIDIAVDLNGYTDGFRAPVFAGRAAPIQVNFLGYPGTLGATYYDYILADEMVIPRDQRPFYTERVVCLPDCYQPNDPLPLTRSPPQRSEHGLPEDAFVFCCFNGPHKILPDTFGIWMQLLERVPGSVLWLSHARESCVSNLRREAERRHVSPDRLVFARRVPQLSDHLARYGLADLFLDTLPFNAHTTACDALWSGLPVLTCMGSTFAGRVAASLLTTLGLPELICQDRAGYVARALELATNPDSLRALRSRLARHRATGPLFDPERYRRNLEAAYETMLLPPSG